MKFSLNTLNSLVLTALLAGAGVSAMAQDSAPETMPAPMGKMAGPRGGDHPMMGHRDPAKMQAWMAKHQAALKAKLKITSSQEAAWSAWTSAMQPPAQPMHERMTPEQRAEFAKLTTPERIDKMHALRTEHMATMNAEMDKREEATKALYAALTPAQQKTFDAEHRNMGAHGDMGPHNGMGPREGHGRPEGRMQPPKN